MSSYWYAPAGELLVPTPLTIGPWDPRLQHGGPPAALLARAIEALDGGEAFVTTRITVDLLRPIPLARLRAAAQLARGGRQARWIDASLEHEGVEVARARAVQVLRRELALPPPHTPLEPPLAPPEAASPPFEFPFFPCDPAYHRAIELRVLHGAWPLGPVTVWARPLVELVAGEPLAGVPLVLALADAINGFAPALPMGGFRFVNADLQVSLRRPPVGPWIGFAVRSTPDACGAGLVHARLFDGTGELGFASESLVLTPL